MSLEDLPKEELLKKCKSLLLIAQKAKQAKDALTEENNELKAALLNNDDNTTQELIQNLTQQKLEYVTCIEDLKRDNKLAHEQHKKLENQLADLDTENVSFKRQIARLTDENEQLISDLDSLEKKTKELQAVGLEQQQQLLTLEKNNQVLSLLENANADLKTQLVLKTEELATHISKSDDLNIELHKNKALVEKLKQDVLVTTTKLSDNQIVSSGVTSDLQNTNEKLKEKLKSYKEKIKQFSSIVKHLKEDRKMLLVEFKTYTAQILDWKSQLEKLALMLENSSFDHNQYEELKTKYLNKDALIKQLESEIGLYKSTETQLAEESKKEIIKLNETNDALERANEYLKHRISQLEEKPVVVEKDCQTVQDTSEYDAIKRENAELLAEMNEMNQALKERGETISKQQEYCEDLMRKLKISESQFSKHSDILESKEKTIQKLQEELSNSGNFEKIQEEIEETEKKLVELRNENETLREKISSLEGVQESGYCDSEVMSTSTISRCEEMSRLRDLEGSWEERYTKLRNFAIKMKSKIRDLSAELVKEQSEKGDLQVKIANNLKTISNLQNQYDKVHDDVDALKKENSSYAKSIEQAAREISENKRALVFNEETIAKLKSEAEQSAKEKSSTENWKRQVNSKVQNLKKELEANNLIKKDFETQITRLQSEVESKELALKEEIEKHNHTRNNLLESSNECKKQSLLTLEIQDYERSLKELTQKNEKKQELVSKLKSQIETLKNSSDNSKDQNKLLEERITSQELEIEALKSEVGNQKKILGDVETVISQKDDRIQELGFALEKALTDQEESATELARAISGNQKANEALKSEKEYLRSQNLGLEQMVRETHDKLKLKEDELVALQQEHSSYKIRAQSVLRQNQSRDVGVEEKLALEANTFKTQVDGLKEELEQMRSDLKTCCSEREQLKIEKQQHLTKLQECEADLLNYKQQYEQLSQKHQQTILDNKEAIRNLKIHSEMLAQCYKQQLADQESRHNHEIIELQSRLERVPSPPEVMFPIPNVPREDGEGSEYVDSSPPAPAHPVPLETLLSCESSVDFDYMKKQLLENETKVNHLTALLADTEQDLAKHVQMNKLLKEEIRRQQRSIEREKHAENLEYLKNVIFKFLILGNGDERERLVPVLNTILKLSPEETQKLNSIAKGDPGLLAWTKSLPLWSSPNK